MKVNDLQPEPLISTVHPHEMKLVNPRFQPKTIRNVGDFSIHSTWWQHYPNRMEVGTLPRGSVLSFPTPAIGYSMPILVGSMLNPDCTADLWLWSSEHGWLWTAPSIYPHLFQNSSASWLYFLTKRNGKPYFYDYTTESLK